MISDYFLAFPPYITEDPLKRRAAPPACLDSPVFLEPLNRSYISQLLAFQRSHGFAGQGAIQPYTLVGLHHQQRSAPL